MQFDKLGEQIKMNIPTHTYRHAAVIRVVIGVAFFLLLFLRLLLLGLLCIFITDFCLFIGIFFGRPKVTMNKLEPVEQREKRFQVDL